MFASPNSNRAPSTRLRDNLTAAGLGLLVLMAILLTRPFANVPMNDDFSYARTAQAFAATGRMIYNGWGSPLLWPQSAYGAIVIRLFGFSYTYLAETGAVMAVAATSLFYVLARRCGCRPIYAAIATLVLTLNPMFLCVAPTYMTDVPSLTLFLITLLLTVRAIGQDESGNVRVEPGWMIASALSGVFGGSNRQLIWFCELAALVALFVLIPRQRKFIGILIGIVFDFAVAMNYWYDSQPYSVSPNPDEGIRRLCLVPGAVAVSILRYLIVAGLLLLPVAVASQPRLRAIGIRPRTVALTTLAWLILVVIPYHNPVKMPSFGIYPYAEYFTSQGALIGGPPGYSRRAIVFPWAFSAALTLAGALGLGIFSVWTWLVACDLRSAVRRARASATDAHRATVRPTDTAMAATTDREDRMAPDMVAVDGKQRAIQAVLMASCLVQFVASFFWFCANYLYDRYLLLFVPGFLIFLALQASKQRVPPVALRLAWLGTALLAIIGFTFAQEYAAYGHARADLFHALRQRGVAIRNINGGLELDADCQICLMGYVNSPQVVKPVGAFNPNLKAQHVSFLPEEFVALDPYFRITTDSVILKNEDVYQDPVMTVTYRSLLPPFERKMFVYRVKRR